MTGGRRPYHAGRSPPRDAGVDEATALPFLVMELLDGVDLDHVIETQKTISPAR